MRATPRHPRGQAHAVACAIAFAVALALRGSVAMAAPAPDPVPAPAATTTTTAPPAPTPAATVAAADSLSIEACADLARRLAPTVQAAALDMAAARSDSAAAIRSTRPVATFFARATVAPDGFYDPAFTNLGDYETKVGISVPFVSRGASRRAHAIAANDVRLSRLERDRAAREAGTRAVELAVELLRLREQERSGVRALVWLNDLSLLLASRVRVGSAGPADTVRVALERDAVQAGLEGTRADAAAAGREMAQLIGLAIPSLPPIREPGPGAESEPTAQDSLHLLASIPRLPEVEAAHAARIRATLETAQTRARNGWQLDLGADAGLAGTNLTAAVPPELRDATPNANVGDRIRRDIGASLSFEARHAVFDPAFGPAVTANQLKAQAAALRAGTEERGQQREALDLLDRWDVSWRRLREARHSVSRAEENLLRSKSLYAAGATGMLDLLDARRVLDDARVRLADARAVTRMIHLEVEARP